MPYALLDDQFHSNPKVIAMGLDGAGLYARALSYCGDYLTDGYIPLEWAKAIVGRSRRLLEHLVTVGAWAHVHPGDEITYTDKSGNPQVLHVHVEGFWIPDYTTFNPSKSEYEAMRNKKVAAGRKGAIKRWSDNNSHSTSHDSRHSTRDSRTDDTYLAPRARGPLPLPQPQELNPAAAATTQDAPAAAAARTIERLEALDLAATTLLAANPIELINAWLDLADTEARANPAGFVIAGLATGQPPSPRVQPDADAHEKRDPVERRESFVRGDGHRLPVDELEYQLAGMGAEDDELVGLLELAADLRAGAAAA